MSLPKRIPIICHPLHLKKKSAEVDGSGHAFFSKIFTFDFNLENDIYYVTCLNIVVWICHPLFPKKKIRKICQTRQDQSCIFLKKIHLKKGHVRMTGLNVVMPIPKVIPIICPPPFKYAKENSRNLLMSTSPDMNLSWKLSLLISA